MKNQTKLEKRGGGNLNSLNFGAFQLSPFKKSVIPDLIRNLFVSENRTDSGSAAEVTVDNKNRKELINLFTYPLINFKPAFTLAEVLITLGIIGVIAAMTIPTLMQKYFEIQTVARFKELNSILAQAIKLSIEENGEVSGWGNVNNTESGALIIAKNLKPYLKLAHDCGPYDSKRLCVASQRYKFKNGKIHDFNFATTRQYYKVVLMNGSSVFWRGLYSADPPINGEIPIMAFFFDINGKKQPNTIGYDVFEFLYYESYGLLPAGWQNPSECLKKDDRGYVCSYYLFKTGKMDYMRKK